MTSQEQGRLVIPSPMYLGSIRDYLQACAEIETALPWDPPFDSDDSTMHHYINDLARGYWFPNDRSEAASPVTHFWYVIDSTIIGRCSLRHTLIGEHGESHGHIGYDIHPDYRGRGFGKQLLSALLDKAKSRGMHDVLITCHPENIASRRIIESCGGILRDLYRDEYLRFDVHL